jgi:hypothetical protein
MYRILFISEYICQAGNFSEDLFQARSEMTTQGNLCQQKVLWLRLLLFVTGFVDCLKGKRNAIISGCHPFAGNVLGNCFVLVL